MMMAQADIYYFRNYCILNNQVSLKENLQLIDMWCTIIKIVFIHCPIMLPLLEKELISHYKCINRSDLYKKLG